MAEKVLVIDDDALNLKMAEYLLKDTYDVICAKSGAKGLELIYSESMDLVLLDLKMPEMSGLEVLEKIRADEKISDTKVVILTASEVKEDVTEAMRLGALDIVKKPFLPSDLFERIQKALQVDEKEQILVVDDDRMNLLFAKKMLGIRYDVDCVQSGEEALAYLKETVPNMILLDLHMPGMSGLEVIGQVQQMKEVRDVPVIFLTSDCDRETEIEIFNAGAMDYIQKPFTAELVLRRIGRILELYRYQHSLQKEVDKKTAELQESNCKVTRLSTQVMLALASVIDAKDTYTKGHSMRVAKYSRELARRMGKSRKEINDIYYIALMHDIGKIGVPDEIINKPGRLSEEEYAAIKMHPVIGADILKNISEMPDLTIGARWHHERYDGKGYPDGLAGEEIPQIARIIGVADSYDAMSSNRSYRGVLTQAKVREEIEKGIGTQFDPVIADYMIEMIDEDTQYQMHEMGSAS